jgi:hypothetical protein
VPFVSITRLRVRSVRFLPIFFLQALRTGRQAARSDGTLSARLAAAIAEHCALEHESAVLAALERPGFRADSRWVATIAGIPLDDVNIDAFIAKASALGASVIVPKSELPDGDALAIVLDPAGLSFGLYRPRNDSPT